MDDLGRLASALRKFKEEDDGKLPPNNAVTLWRAICRGVERVADALENKDD